MNYLKEEQVLQLYEAVMATSGGLVGIRNLDLLDSALSQPQMTFGGEDIYKTLPEKADALGYSLICNHPFLDGNKRIGHAVMEAFLMINGQEIECDVDEQEKIILSVAAGEVDLEEFSRWVKDHVVAG